MPLDEACLRAHTTPEAGFEAFGREIFHLLMDSAVQHVRSLGGNNPDSLEIPFSIVLEESKARKCIGAKTKTPFGTIETHINVDLEKGDRHEKAL